ncbi:MAG: acyl-CoA synthetase [Gammaproteobacteria bacterium]|nr:acyl-CoA synthetase [Gammaproteobacteria bacterium]
MPLLTDYLTHADAEAHCSSDALWALFEGDREYLNIAHECVDRHARGGRTAVIVARAEGGDDCIDYAGLARDSARFAHLLRARGVLPGDRIAMMLEPSRAFYVCLFGAMKLGAIAVPLFTLFGPDALRLRLQDCGAKLLITHPARASLLADFPGLAVLPLIEFDDAGLAALLAEYPASYPTATRADDLAIFQYTSGTTRELPEAVRHTHRAVVTLMLAALYGSGLRPGDRFFCPSSPAWGHGLWHGTLAPLALGLTIGAYAGRFDPVRLLEALSEHRFNNLAAAATHYRMIRNSGAVGRYPLALQKISFTGEPLDSETAEFLQQHTSHEPASMYGTTEVGVVLVCYPGAPDFQMRRGSLGKPVPGVQVSVRDASGNECPPGVTGEIMVRRRDRWIPTHDLGRTDQDGYFYHGGRADDVIISAGWTMSAVEIEDTLLKHPEVLEAAAIGVPDALRGQVVKAYVVCRTPGDEVLAETLREFVRTRLSLHEYPRQIAFVNELPKTPAGKINRRVLRQAAVNSAPSA